jgi:preprotein translocase subunit SecA
MLGLLKQITLNSRQSYINRAFPGMKIFLNKEMPMSSINSVAGVVRKVHEINKFEQQTQKLSDAELRQKTGQFRQHIEDTSKEIAAELAALSSQIDASTIPEEKDRLKERIKNLRNRVFDGIMAEAFACVREASIRTIGLRHFDVQLAGGIFLHQGTIAEMSTGEGKTLVATLPAYLNALLGKGVHIVTVNDYLARRDSEWMGPIYNFLGLSVGVIQHDLNDAERKAAYACDITYGTNNEFGFDYLRDNMKYGLDDLVQRGFYYGIVDEVDSILIDEARTPLIISGASDEATDKYYAAKRIADQLRGRRITESQEIDAKHKGEDVTTGYDYIADEKAHTIALTEEGESRAAKLWGVDNLHSIETMEHKHHINQALRAKEFFRLDTEYIVKDGQVIIVDEFTGRLMPGRRWSDGLHQAVEAKEGMKIEQENQTLATITFQNYFRMYEKLAGMTGTAITEANEFKSIYKVDTIVLPTNRPLIRCNYPDCVYKSEKEKFAAVVEEIAELHAKGRPVLVGTISIERSERLAEMLKRRGVTHQVLNAKYHEQEAQIVAQAGRFKGVTIATNMAGRGTDILLGGNPDYMAKNIIRQKMLEQKLPADDLQLQEEYRKISEKLKKESAEEHNRVVELGGLHVLGTERHEARRIDNQLRGRCGRQGDPGSSRFYVSFEDDLLRLFAPEWILKMLQGLETNGEPLTLKEGGMAHMLSKSIETAQRRVEQHNFEIRRQLLEYDNVMNKQREVIYSQRRQVLGGVSLRDEVLSIAAKMIERIVTIHYKADRDTEPEDLPGMIAELEARFGLQITVDQITGKPSGVLIAELIEAAERFYAAKDAALGADTVRQLERMVFLQIIDAKWKDHLYAMDKLREGIGLRAYGHRDPLIEYKNEAFSGFTEMIGSIEDESVEMIFKLQPAPRPERERISGVFSRGNLQMSHPEAGGPHGPERRIQGSAAEMQMGGEGSHSPVPRSSVQHPVQSEGPVRPKVGRNDPCPCGSGNKYKKCCGK